MTKPKQTSSAVSSIAGRYVRMTNEQFLDRLYDPIDAFEGDYDEWRKWRRAFFRDIRKLAASCLAQDEKPAKPRK